MDVPKKRANGQSDSGINDDVVAVQCNVLIDMCYYEHTVEYWSSQSLTSNSLNAIVSLLP